MKKPPATSEAKMHKFTHVRSFALSSLYALALSIDFMASSNDFPEFCLSHKDSPLLSMITISPNIAAAKPRLRREDLAVKIQIASSNFEAMPPPPPPPPPY